MGIYNNNSETLFQMLQIEGSGFGGHIQEKNYKSTHQKVGVFFEREPIYLSDIFGEDSYVIKTSFKNNIGQVVEYMKNTAYKKYYLLKKVKQFTKKTLPY